MLRRLDLIAVQNDVYANRFRALGASEETLHVTGSMKFDGAITDRNNAKTMELAALAGFDRDDTVLLAGSTQQEEEEMALATFKLLSPQYSQLRLVIVPRHPERFEEVAAMLDHSGHDWQRRSELTAEKEDLQTCRILLVDVVGELGAWWGCAHIALVGGSFGSRGGQNMIEPAAYGAAVSFGPRTRNFRDVVQLMLASDAARVVQDQQQLTAFVKGCLEDPEQARQLGIRAQQLVKQQLGATGRTLQLVAPLVGKDQAGSRED
jgi:3-deoxy-D-manno-octulosonic-acid transferase